MLATRESTAAWDLRSAWALRRVVVLLLDADITRLAGWVDHVDATDAGADIETLEGEIIRVPCATVLAVRSPHFQEPEHARARAAVPRERRETVLDRFPGQLALEFPIEQMGF